MLETKTTVWTVGNTVVVTIPIAMVKDSNFPFDIQYLKNTSKVKTINPVKVKIKIENKKLIIEK